MPPILLCTINARYIHTGLGLRWLKANLGDLEAEAKILEFCLDERPVDMAERILAENPRIVGLGVYIWNALESQRLAALIKQLQPETLVVLGGPEVSHLPMRVHFDAADYIIQGEGELAFARLCAQILRGEQPREKIMRADAPETTALNFPYSLYSDDDIAHRLTYVEASRGCPFTCEFCLSSLDKQVRLFALEPLMAELSELWNRGARTFKFVDRSFNCSEQVALAILDFFLARTPPFHVHFEVVPDHFPQAIQDRLKRFPPASLQLEIGIQTLDEQVARSIGRRLHVEKIRKNLRFLREETGAHLHLDLIMGLPGESVAGFAAGLNQLVAWCPEAEIQLGILKKLSGTAISRHDREYGMVYSQVPPYELLQNNLTPFAQMQELRRMARFWDLLYNSGNFRLSVPRLWPDGLVFEGFFAFSRWLFQKTRATWKIALPKLAGLLFTYLTQERGQAPEEVANLLAQDLLTVKGRVLPEVIQAQASIPPAKREAPLRSLAKRQDRASGAS